ncbi:MAG: helix-turn-helix domain-containing protein [Calditerrivibrio sp.]|uniref:helix-turn-helix domain-containing protein n=1 Tax=Calditerrivibrio sp. TaxID=2792612 RepID=UPI003D0A2323
MSNLGSILKNRREELGKDIQTVSKELRINQKYLQAIENGDFRSLPSYVHCYGFVKNYIKYLALNEQEMMELFSQECPKSIFNPNIKNENTQIFDEVNKEVSKSQIKKRVYIYSTISIIFILIAIIYIYSIKKTKIVDNESAVKSSSENLSVSPINDNSDKNSPKTTDNIDLNNPQLDNKAILQQLYDNSASPKDNSADNKTVLKQVKLSFYNTCWVNVKIDNKTELDFIAKPGYTREFSFKDFFIIDIGDASAISISYNNQTIGGLGKPRESIKNLYFTLNNDKLTYTKK